MQITTENIKALKPCPDRFYNFTSNYPNYKGSLIDFLNLDNITYNDKVWVFTRLATHIQNVHWSILCSESVLQNYEVKYPSDNRPRKAIEAAKAFVLNPSEENRQLANSAHRDADCAFYAAYFAVKYAKYAATSAASCAASCATFTHYATCSANSANYAAASAGVAAKETQQELNLQFMVEAVRIGKGE